MPLSSVHYETADCATVLGPWYLNLVDGMLRDTDVEDISHIEKEEHLLRDDLY